MNNYYTLIYLTEHLKNKLTGSVWQFSTSPHRNVWEGIFKKTDEENIRLVFSTQPGEIALFTDHYRPPKKSNTLTFFDNLSGKKVRDVALAEGDRLITISFTDNEQILFQLFGNRANLYRIHNNSITDRFKESGRKIGDSPPEPRISKTGFPDVSTSSSGNNTDRQDDRFANKSAAQLMTLVDNKFPRQLTQKVIDQYKLEDAQPARIQDVVQTLTEAMRHSDEFHVIRGYDMSLLPHKLLDLELLQTFSSVNEAIRECYFKKVKMRRFDRKKESLVSSLETSCQKMSRNLDNLQQEDDVLQRADDYEKKGHLLMANAHLEFPAGQTTIKLNDLYDENRLIDVPLKPDLDLAGNGGRYYQKAAKARREAANCEVRRKKLTKELVLLQKLTDSLKSIDYLSELREWEEENSEVLQNLGILTGPEQKTSSPFRKTDLDGFELWIGKNAKSNDEVTRQAHKEDIWLHARGTPGSHVVIRMNNTKEYPPQKILLRAAGIAAWHSKQRGAEIVPVIITKRKYVTKPKQAAAGLVRVQKEKVELVTPVES